MILQSSCKQHTVVDSSTAAEYIVASESSHECVCLCALLVGVGLEQVTPTPILCDNNSAITLSQDQLFHSCVKHLDVHGTASANMSKMANSFSPASVAQTTLPIFLPNLCLLLPSPAFVLFLVCNLPLKEESFIFFLNPFIPRYLSSFICVFIEEECWRYNNKHTHTVPSYYK
jgi:hypothetical protein